MDLAAIGRRAKELAAQRDTLDKLDVASLANLAKKTYSEVEKTLGEGTGAPWYVRSVPLAKYAIDFFEESRFKDSLNKLKYAKGWLDNAESAKSDSGQRIAYKQSFSDSAHALQLFWEESTKGSTIGRLYDKANETVDKQISDIRTQFLIGAAIVGFVAWAVGQSDKK